MKHARADDFPAERWDMVRRICGPGVELIVRENIMQVGPMATAAHLSARGMLPEPPPVKSPADAPRL
jgi:hypothetical protein